MHLKTPSNVPSDRLALRGPSQGLIELIELIVETLILFLLILFMLILPTEVIMLILFMLILPTEVIMLIRLALRGPSQGLIELIELIVEMLILFLLVLFMPILPTEDPSRMPYMGRRPLSIAA